MDPPDEEDEQVHMPEIPLVGDDVPICVPSHMSIHAGGGNEATDNEDQQDEVQRAIDEQVLSLQKKLDKGKGILNSDQVKLKRKNIEPRSKGNGIVIRENDDPSYGNDRDSDSDSETDQEKGFYRSDESDSGDSLKSYDYLSHGEDEVIQLRKRMYEFKSGGAEGEEHSEPNQNEQNPPSQDEGFPTPLRMFDMGISDTIKEHEQDMDILMRRIKAKGNDLKDPFHLVDKTERYPLYDEATHWKLKKPKLGEKFVTVEQFKECLTYYALANGFTLWYDRSGTDQVIAKCGRRKEVIKDPSKGKQRAYKKFPTKDPNEASSHSICPWRCYAKKLKVDGSFQVISLKDEHTCVKNFNYGTLINYKWLGKHFGDKIRANPKITLHALADLVMKKYSCIVSPNQCRRAKEYALSEGECSLQDHYGMLWSYAKAILVSNEGSTVRVSVTVNPDEKTYFDRFYVCLHGLKEGWKLGCRNIIALDGCFLKKPNSGEILTAVGRDGRTHSKKGCKNPTIPKPPKEKGKVGRPKKIVPIENENEVHHEDTTRFVNTSISEFNKASSENFVVFNDGRRVNLGTNWNKNTRGGKSASSYFVKMRGGKSSRGGLLPAERLGKIDKWLVVDGASSNTSDDTRALQSSHVATKSNQNNASIVIGTQESQFVGGFARMKGNQREAQNPNSSPSTSIGVKMSRGKQSKTRYLANTYSSPPIARQTYSEPAAQPIAQLSRKKQVTPATQEEPQLRGRQQAEALPQREKSQRILLRKVSKKITGPGSSIDKEIFTH